MEFDALAELRAMGFRSDAAPTAVREVLGSLSPAEVGFLQRLDARIAAAAPDALAHSVEQEDAPRLATYFVIT